MLESFIHKYHSLFLIKTESNKVNFYLNNELVKTYDYHSNIIHKYYNFCSIFFDTQYNYINKKYIDSNNIYHIYNNKLIYKSCLNNKYLVRKIIFHDYIVYQSDYKIFFYEIKININSILYKIICIKQLLNYNILPIQIIKNQTYYIYNSKLYN